MNSLLPPNSSVQEKAIEASIVRMTDLPVSISDIWDPDKCSVALLPWLAWSLSVDEWDANWSEDQKRQSIRDSITIHQKKGTVGSIKRVLNALGYKDAVVVEGQTPSRYDNIIKYDNSDCYGKSYHWAMYRVFLHQPITIKQAEQVRSILTKTAPARAHLAGLHYDQALNVYNGALDYNGTYSHGVA